MTNLTSPSKIKTALAIALGSLLLTACETQPLTPSNATLPSGQDATQPLPQTTSMRVGQSLVVVLPANRGPNLTWRVQNPLPAFLSLISETTSSSAADGTGTPDQQVFNFTADRPGEGNLAFLLVRRGGQVGALDAAVEEIRTTLVRVSAP